MEFTLAKIEDFNEVQNLYWNLIDQSKDELSFPDWKKGEHPSPDLIMDSIKQEHLYVLKDEGIIKACAICKCLANKEYESVSWQVKDKANNVWILHALAVGYEYRNQGFGTILVRHILSQAQKEGIEAIHLDVIDKNTVADKLYEKLGFKYISTENIFYEVVGNREFRMYEYTFDEKEQW